LTHRCVRARIQPALQALLDDKSWDTALQMLHYAVNIAILSHASTGDASYYGRSIKGQVVSRSSMLAQIFVLL
jgi:hypothetical protein